MKNRWRSISTCICVLFSVFFLASCGGNSGSDGKNAKGRGPVPVRAAVVKAETVQQELAVVGHVEASSIVKVGSQVTGQIMEVSVQPGQYVKKGQVLFMLDQRPFVASYNQAEASFKREQTLLAKGEQDLVRYQSLIGKDAISREQYDQARTNAESLRSTLAQSQAVLAAARLQLEYSTIHAPDSGRIGDVLIQAGNLVRANDASVMIINTISPAEVSFAVPEKNLPELMKRMRNGAVEVRVLPQGDKGEPVRGVLTLMDNTVDRSTGTIAMRATFENADERLWPGAFVRVYIVMEDTPNALVLPAPAILEGMSGQYVYVIKDDKTVAVRMVETVVLPGGKVQVTKGLESGETVVLDGQLNLYPDAAVDIKE